MTEQYCIHPRTTKRFEVPLDVKTDSTTRFGTVFQCSDCALSFVKPCPDAHQLKKHYNLPSYYTHGESHLPKTAASIIDRLVIHLAWRTDRGTPFHPAQVASVLPANAQALDIGCGSGRTMSEMKELGMTALGVDPDETALAQARNRGHTVFTGAAETLPVEILSKQFDFITMWHVLEHCLNPVKALSEVRSILAPDGLFYCEVPNAGSIYFETYGQISETLDVPRHLYFFQKKNLEAAAAQAGLVITDWRFHGLTRHFNMAWKTWENGIYDRLKAADGTLVCPRRSRLGDLKLLASGLFKPPQRRYDCIGFIARPA